MRSAAETSLGVLSFMYESVETKRRASPGGFYAKIRLYVRLDGFYSSLRVLVLVAIPVGSGFRGEDRPQRHGAVPGPRGEPPREDARALPRPFERGARHDVVVNPADASRLAFAGLFLRRMFRRGSRTRACARPNPPRQTPRRRRVRPRTPRRASPPPSRTRLLERRRAPARDGRAKKRFRASRFSQRTIRLRESSREPRELCDEARRRPRTR